MTVLRYNWIDVFNSAFSGLRYRKTAVAFPGVVLGFAWWTVFSYLALLLQGIPFRRIWMAYGMIPWPTVATLGDTLTVLLWLAGCAGSALAWLLATTAVSRISFEQLRGNEFTSWSEAWCFSLTRWKTFATTPAVLFGGALASIIGLLVLSFIARLWAPLSGILFILAVPAALMLVYMTATGFLSLLYAPAIVATSNSHTLETVFESLSMHAGQGRRGWFYALVSAVMSAVTTTILGLVLIVVSQLSTWILDFGRAGTVGAMYKQAGALIPRVASWLNGVPGFYDAAGKAAGLIERTPHDYSLLWEHPSAATIIIAVWLTILFLIASSQFVATFGSCSTTAYVIVRQFKDEQNLLEEDLPSDPVSKSHAIPD